MSSVIALVVGGLVIALDQLTKYLVANNFTTDMAPISLLGGLFNLHYTENGGAAWSILEGSTWFLIAITLVIMIVCIYMLIKKTFDSKLMFWALSLVLAGGIGNLIDRIFRGGLVVDFIEFGFFEFPIFNVADISVCVGAGLIVLYFIIDTIKEYKLSKKEKEELPEAKEEAK